MSNVEFSTENLIQLLDNIKTGIVNEEIPTDLQQSLWEKLLLDKNDPDTQEMLKYLFTGWWVHQLVME